MSAVLPIRRSPCSALHRRLGGRVEVEAAWELIADYGDVSSERALIRDEVGLADVTPRAKIDIRGSIDAAVSEAGAAFVARIGREWALVLGEPGAEIDLMPKLAAAAGAGTMVTDATHLYAGFALSGPGLADVLARMTGWDPGGLEPGSATGAPIAEVRAVVVRPRLVTPSIEIYVDSERARFVWETLLDVVERRGGGAVGWGALRAEGWR